MKNDTMKSNQFSPQKGEKKNPERENSLVASADVVVIVLGRQAAHKVGIVARLELGPASCATATTTGTVARGRKQPAGGHRRNTAREGRHIGGVHRLRGRPRERRGRHAS